jgi:FKBP-type peptidyl-prolyl cis-trans isomerase
MSKRVVYFLIPLLVIVVGYTFLSKQPEKQKAKQVTNQKMATNQATDSGKLSIEDIKVGEGREVLAGDTVVMHYKGTLTDGTKFDSSYDRNEPFETRIGVGQVIQGWDMGVPGMKIGGKRKLVIPPSLGYGEHGAGGVIPPNATLIFEVELLDIK